MRPDMPTLDAETYASLRALAGRLHARGRGHTLQPTALLHEAWSKLEQSQTSYKDREHFMAVAATAMRQILVNRARDRVAQKRGGGAAHTTLSGLAGETRDPVDLLLLDTALERLAAVDPRAAEVVELRVFAGLTIGEVAAHTGLAARTVSRAWRYALAFLQRELG